MHRSCPASIPLLHINLTRASTAATGHSSSMRSLSLPPSGCEVVHTTRKDGMHTTRRSKQSPRLIHYFNPPTPPEVVQLVTAMLQGTKLRVSGHTHICRLLPSQNTRQRVSKQNPTDVGELRECYIQFPKIKPRRYAPEGGGEGGGGGGLTLETTGHSESYYYCGVSSAIKNKRVT